VTVFHRKKMSVIQFMWWGVGDTYRERERGRERPKKDELDPVAEHEKWINV